MFFCPFINKSPCFCHSNQFPKQLFFSIDGGFTFYSLPHRLIYSSFPLRCLPHLTTLSSRVFCGSTLRLCGSSNMPPCDMYKIGLSETDLDLTQQCMYKVTHELMGHETFSLQAQVLQDDIKEVKKEESESCHLRNLNTYYNPKCFNETRDPPLHVGFIKDQKAFQQVDVTVEELLIKCMGEEEYHIPEELRGCTEVIQMGINYFHKHMTPEDAKEYSCYLTTTESIIPPCGVQRFKSIHADGLLGAKHLRKDGTYAHKLSFHMNLCSDLPTNFYVQPIDVASLDPTIHDFCKYFEKNVTVKAIHPSPYELIMFDGYSLHSSPRNTSEVAVKRRFFSLEFTPRLYNTDGVTKNAYFLNKKKYPLQLTQYQRIYLATKAAASYEYLMKMKPDSSPPSAEAPPDGSSSQSLEKISENIANAIAKGELSNALDQIKSALSDAKNDKIMTSIRQQACRVHVLKGEYDKALHYLEEAFTNEKELSAKASIKNEMGNIFRRQGQYKQALTAYEEAKSFAQQCEDSILEASIIGNISFIYRCFEKPEEAVKQALLQLKAYEKQGLGDTRNSAVCHSNIGINLRLIGKFEESLAEQQIAHSIAEALQDEELIVSTAITMASSYRSLGDKDNAVRFYEKALLLAEGSQQAEFMHLAQVEKVFCTFFNETKEPEQDIDGDNLMQNALIKSCEKLTELNSSYQAKAFNVLGRLNLIKKNFPDAEKVYSKALSLAEAAGNVFELGLARLGLGLVYVEQRLDDTVISAMLNGISPGDMSKQVSGAPRYTACMAAAFMGWTRDFRLLLTHGADYSLYDEKGYTLFDYANLNNHLDAICKSAKDIIDDAELALFCEETHLKSLIRMILMDKLQGADTASRLRKQFRVNFSKPAEDVVKENALLVKVPELLDEVRVIPFEKFKENGMMPHSSKNLASVISEDQEENIKVIFVSHRWLRPHYCEGCRDKTCGLEGNPDDEKNSKWQNIVDVVNVIMKQLSWDPANIRLWIDFSSLDQSNIPRLLAGTHTLPFYVMASDAFVCLHNETYWQRSWCLVEAMFAQLSYESHGFPLRFQVSATGAVTPIADDVKAVPSQGALTTELDRRNVRFLEMVAKLIM